MMAFDILFMLLVVLQIADAYFTHVILYHLHGRELNPIMNYLFDRIGYLTPTLIAKSAVIVSAYFLEPYDFAVPFLIAACMFYTIVVFHNYREIHK